MSDYAILRVKKLKTVVAIRGSMRHTFREQPTPNAEPERMASNTLMTAKSTEEGMENFRAILPEKVRKNAVLAIEYLITASPEVMAEKSKDEQDRYLNDSLEWLREKHGADNVFCAVIHRDETTPHLVAYVMPRDERGKLNCRKFLGERSALRQIQTDFADRVGKRHGLKRGIEGSKAKHQTVSRYYATIQKNAPESDSTTFFGNIRPDAHEGALNALRAFQEREKAIKNREQVLEQKISEAEGAIEAKESAELAAREDRQARYRVELERDRYKQQLDELREEYQVMDQARMDAIDEARHYRDLIPDNQRDLGL